MSDAYVDSEGYYCEEHIPEPESDEVMQVSYQEVDVPLHCSECHRPLDCTLTIEGVKYVREHVLDEIRQGRAHYLNVSMAYGGTYYEGVPHVYIVRDWVQEHSIDDPLIDRAIRWMEYQESKQVKAEDQRGK